MMTWFGHSFTTAVVLRAAWQTIRGAGLVDYFDVAFVTALIYLVLRWIQRRRAIRVLQGMLMISLLYLVALRAGLALTTTLFRGLLTVVMLSMASLFQEDLRHFFERLTVYRRDPMHRRMFQALLRSVRYFSKHHIGALIVIKGRDPLDRHLAGGQPLEGHLSSALLESLFDPHSDGHDGAIIVDGDAIQRFGVHLPLSKHIDPELGLGTRHAAALGLSELTDACCLVVSESRGSVMIAREGRLVNMGGGQRLEKRLSGFLRDRFQPSGTNNVWKVLCAHPVEKGVAVALGLVLWLVFVKGIRPVEQVMTLPVQFAQLPRGYALETLAPEQAAVTFSGLEKDLRVLPKDLAITLETPRLTHKTQRLLLAPYQVRAPERVSVSAISPGSVALRLKPAKSERHAAPKLASAHHAWFHFR